MPKPGMIACSVEEHHGAWLISIGKTTLLLQTDYDQAAFAVNCGAIKAPVDWDGRPSTLDQEAWISFQPSDITECPDDYLEVADEVSE